MTTSDDASSDPLQRLDDERSELQREIAGLHAQLSEDGPMDGADRAAILTQVEELEGVLSGLDRRRETLLGEGG